MRVSLGTYTFIPLISLPVKTIAMISLSAYRPDMSKISSKYQLVGG